MERPSKARLRIGEWCFTPASGELSRNGKAERLDSRTSRLLLCLAERPGEVVSIEDLLNQAWAGVNVGSDSVYQAVASLRRVLGDDPKQPAYIETVPRLGYRMVSAVSLWGDQFSPSPDNEFSAKPTYGKVILTWAAVFGLALISALLFYGRVAKSHSDPPAMVKAPQNSVAVLPFLDLTEGMKDEEFADGLTEELIGRLSKIPGLHVPAPTSSFYYKEKQVPVPEIAKSLDVAYVLDGSVRKSGGRLRIATRLVQAESGYIVWSETYDRPVDDILMVQDDIADKVSKALRASLAGSATAR